ncbi:cell division topological specificity factor MinE [Candidatus Wirthbacteria bacterium CG2_30_54_11]|uniref:Cell division topological specificity factor MinE n=1 Tax=Candidatus Wirthbacteria bacterium CG2_30_54_11 TaxID=1817892 RepID=A0A1J5IPZ8_9BACT|nr:MAG: cell division topological specificity factor MinE [Candidatus Wirthbacteria bacterium CG2_30_54_11]
MPSIWEIMINIFKKGSDDADTAHDRLKLVLRKDRVKITPEALEGIKRDILKTISQYVDIEENNLQLDIQYTGTDTSIVASMPVKGGRAEITGKRTVATPDKDEATAALKPPKSPKTAAKKPRKSGTKKTAKKKSTRKKAAAQTKPVAVKPAV